MQSLFQGEINTFFDYTFSSKNKAAVVVLANANLIEMAKIHNCFFYQKFN
jgi:hypothetical protein